MKHRKPNPPGSITAKNIALGATVALGGAAAATVTGTGAAQAATVNQWDRIAACESGDMNILGSARWNLPYGDGGSTGGLQIQLGTWNDFGGPQYAPQAYQATKKQQILVAEKILAVQGASAWVCNQPGHGIASGALGYSTGQSSLKGGPAPYPDTVADPVAPAPEPAVQHHRRSQARRYTVKPGDYLIKIAREQNVQGGWHSLYARNRSVIGPNPNRIEPGQVLCLDGWGHRTPPAPPKPPTPAPSAQGYVLPLPSGSYTKGDGLIVGAGGSMSRSAGGHSGQDLTAPSGTVVRSVTKGLVVGINAAGAAYGNHVVVQHPDGKYTLYAHMSAIAVTVGQLVDSGQQVGNVGSTGNSSGPHLHFEVRTDPTAFNSSIFLSPVQYMAAHGVTL
jgi:murein DD-endopeptidase MepM/ murein hydrolase activator NlpD